MVKSALLHLKRSLCVCIYILSLCLVYTKPLLPLSALTNPISRSRPGRSSSSISPCSLHLLLKHHLISLHVHSQHIHKSSLRLLPCRSILIILLPINSLPLLCKWPNPLALSDLVTKTSHLSSPSSLLPQFFNCHLQLCLLSLGQCPHL